MKTLNLKSTDLNNLIGYGAEGRVYLLENGLACKVFYDPNIVNEKLKKVSLIKDLNMYSLPNVYHNVKIDGFLSGYTMEYIHYDEPLNRLLRRDYDMDFKLEYLKKAEEVMKEMHENDITLVDTMHHNFLVSGSNVYAIDIDNFHTKSLSFNTEPYAAYELYMDNVSTIITPDMDKFTNLIFTLYNLVEDSFELEDIHRNYDYLIDFVHSLDVARHHRELFLEILSDSTNKPYIEDNLDDLVGYDYPYIKRK